MKYYLIAGEASGDLHASHLMKALKERDGEAQFRCIGGDMMQAAGGELVCHYRKLAYMGFVPVLLHLRTILRAMGEVERDIMAWQPDVLIPVDYPGFNLKVCHKIHTRTRIPIYYYIAPKIWAWKEHRIKALRRDVDQILSILPFEVDYYMQRHGHEVHYVGNPTLDEVESFLAANRRDDAAFRVRNALDERPIVALLAGSRRQEVASNLKLMLEALRGMRDVQPVLAAAPGLGDAFYASLPGLEGVTVVKGQTYALLQHSVAALVTSGTATLETALFGVPQVVCYYMPCGWFVSMVRPYFLKCRWVSLVNLIADEEVVPELVAGDLNPAAVRRHLESVLPGGTARQAQIDGYGKMRQRLGDVGAPRLAADKILSMKKHSHATEGKDNGGHSHLQCRCHGGAHAEERGRTDTP